MIRIIPFLIFCLSTICSAELRTWTAVNGKKVEAKYTSSEKGIVKLKLKSGKIFEVHAEKLSTDDNERSECECNRRHPSYTLTYGQ